LTWQWTTGDDPAKGPPWSVRFGPTPAEKAANDTTAELATGGLIFTKSDGLEMISEDLFISMKEVRVKNRFFNHSDQDIHSVLGVEPRRIRNSNFGSTGVGAASHGPARDLQLRLCKVVGG
jgi:hypothetical protein